MSDNYSIIQPIIHTVSATQITNTVIVSSPGPQGPIGVVDYKTLPVTYPITNASGTIGLSASYIPASATYSSSANYSLISASSTYSASSNVSASSIYATNAGSANYSTNSGNSSTTLQTNFNTLTLSGSNVATQAYVLANVPASAQYAGSANYSTSAGYAINSGSSQYATQSASSTISASSITSASSTNASSAQYSLNSTSATISSSAINSSSANISNSANISASSNISSSALYSINSGSSTYAIQSAISSSTSQTSFSTLSVNGDLNVSGNTYVSGSTFIVSASNISTIDPLIYIGMENPANINDLGIVGSFTSSSYQHTGIVRDHSDGVWKLFSGVTTEPTNIINFASAVYDTLKVGGLQITSSAQVVNLNADLFGGITSSSYALKSYVDTQNSNYYSSAQAYANTASLNAYNAASAYTQSGSWSNTNASVRYSANTGGTLIGGSFDTSNTSAQIFSTPASLTIGSTAGGGTQFINIGTQTITSSRSIIIGALILGGTTETINIGSSSGGAGTRNINIGTGASFNNIVIGAGGIAQTASINSNLRVSGSLTVTGIIGGTTTFSLNSSSATISSSAITSLNSASLGGIVASEYATETDVYTTQLTPTTSIDLFPRTSITGTRTLVAGSIYSTGFVPIKSFTLNSVTIVLTSAGTSSIQFGLMSTSGSTVTVVASNVATVPSGTGIFTGSFSTPQTLTAGQSYAIGFLAVGGTNPTLVGQTFSTSNAAISYGLSPLMTAISSTTSYTSIPTAGNTIALNTATPPVSMAWARLS
jgi:hypothetical protein